MPQYIYFINKSMHRNCYEPFSRTYHYLLLQNQLAHHRNKKAVHSTGQSNITLKVTPNHSPRHQENLPHRLNYSFLEPHRVVHKHQVHNRSVKREQHKENQRIAKKLCHMNCSIVTLEDTDKHYQDHLSSKAIARRYSGRLPKDLSLLNTTSLTASRIQAIQPHPDISDLVAPLRAQSQQIKKRKKGNRKKRGVLVEPGFAP